MLPEAVAAAWLSFVRSWVHICRPPAKRQNSPFGLEPYWISAPVGTPPSWDTVPTTLFGYQRPTAQPTTFTDKPVPQLPFCKI